MQPVRPREHDVFAVLALYRNKELPREPSTSVVRLDSEARQHEAKTKNIGMIFLGSPSNIIETGCLSYDFHIICAEFRGRDADARAQGRRARLLY